MNSQPDDPRVLVFSLRNIFGRALNRGPHVELEDIICEVDSAELLAPMLDPSSRRASFATRLAYHAPVLLNPGLPRVPPRRQYDVLFAVCGFPQDLIMFDAIEDLRAACKTSVCLLDELWIKEIAKHRHFLKVLAKFDIVMPFQINTVKPLSEEIGQACVHLPLAIDAMRFCPYPDPPERVIDVYSMGRRSPVIHQTLRAMAQDGDFFYLHDTIGGSQAIDLGEHRTQVANLAKRSRYFLVNPGKFDEPGETGRQVEFGYRYFEGAAAGAIMLGERPDNDLFPRLFDWPDAMIHVPHTSGDIDRVIRELDRDLGRQETMRRAGMAQTLLRHDWVYRWETILDAVRLQPLPGLAVRKDRLKALAEMASGQGPARQAKLNRAPILARS
ncbi:glycosyltransferase [Bradyrhizobium aeschynomenes]|uniref:glycosyltransferase family protein n=1 Tax=Bradyrhizobium aeschynomenes TaxID=2734909 RepID=UPI0015551BBE|nr:glycosyltransferase [Bradyrhizobium aeschynomenes]NPV25599.1 glycosyltransferase [Bradyrhizobium aeschynomenes]